MKTKKTKKKREKKRRRKLGGGNFNSSQIKENFQMLIFTRNDKFEICHLQR